MTNSQEPSSSTYVTITWHDRRAPEIHVATPDTPGAIPRDEAEHLVDTSQNYADLNDLDAW